MSEKRLPYFKFYPQDFMGSGKVQMMTPAERGIYISLLCWSWQEGPLPDDARRLARVAGADAETMERCWPAVRAAFEARDGGRLVHPRLEKEREAARKRSKRARHAAEVRHSPDDDAPSTPPGMPRACPGHARRSAPRGAPDMLYSDAHSLRDSEVPEAQSAARAREEPPRFADLSGWLGAYHGAALAMLDSAPHGTQWARAVWGMFGPDGTDAHLLSPLTEDGKRRAVAAALLSYAGEGRRFKANLFRAFVERTAAQQAADMDPIASADLPAGDRKLLDMRRRMEGVRLEVVQ